MNKDDVFARLKELIVELLEIDESEITMEASFMDDFGADSLDIIELLTAVEEAFGVEIPDEDAEKLTSVGAVIDYLKEKGFDSE